MNNININKEEGVKTIRRLYSAVNDLLDILGRDVSEWGYDKEKLEEKVQAYIKYLGDTKEWEELNKRKDNNEDKNLLLKKVQDDVLDIMSLSTSREDVDKARNALTQLSDVTSADVMDVLSSCVDDGGKVGKSTRYAKKKLVMNSVPSIYEKEETNNGAELYYNVVHGRYQILNGDKIYTTKRGGTRKTQEVDSQERGGEVVPLSVTEEIDENIGGSSVVLETGDTDQKEVIEEGIEKHEEAKKQPERVDTIEEQPKEKNKESGEEVEWSEEKIIEELKKIQNVEGFEDLQRCNDVEFSFLAQQLLKSPETIDLLRRMSLSEGDEKLNAEFKKILDGLFVKFMVNIKHFGEGATKLRVTTKEGELKPFELIKSDLSGELGINQKDLNNLKTISEYMAFICCMNNIKNSVIDANRRIKGTGRGSLKFLLQGKSDPDMSSIIEEYLIPILIREITEFKRLKQEKYSRKMDELKQEKYSRKMDELEKEIELDFSSLISEDSEGKYSLTKNIHEKITKIIVNKNETSIDDGLLSVLLPVFIKMGIFRKNNSIFAHDWFNYVDTRSFTSEKRRSTYPVIKYVINGKVIGLKISKLKDFEYKPNELRRYYDDFKNVVLYTIYKTIKENNDCPYVVDLDEEIATGKLMFTLQDVSSEGEFYENSHGGDDLKKILDKEDSVGNSSGNLDIQPGSKGDNGGKDNISGGEVRGIQKDGEESKEGGESSFEDTPMATEEIDRGEKGENGKKDVGEKKGKKNGRQNKVSQGKENVENITIEDVINFYANNKMEREKLKSYKKAGGSDQRDCSKLRENYRIKISKPGFEKGISLGIAEMASIVGKKIGKKIGKPYSEPGFKTFIEGLDNLIKGNGE